MGLSYAGASLAAPGSGTDNSYVFFKGIFDYIFTQYNSDVGTPTDASTALQLFKRDANAAGNLGSMAIGGATTITNGVAQLLLTATLTQVLDIIRFRQADGTNALRVDPFGNTVIGQGVAYRTLTVIGDIAATRAITAATTVTATGGFVGALTGDVSGNATGVKGVAAGSLLVGTGAGAMAAVAGGTAGFILTSNGAAVAPSWQANAGGGGGGTTADTGLYATQGTNDAPLSDMLKLTATGNVIGAVTAGTTAGTLALTVGSGQPPIVFEGYGRRQKAEFGHAMPVSNAVSTAGQYTLLADLSGTGPYLTGLVLASGAVASATNQAPICQVYFDGTTFYIASPHGPYYPAQPIVNGASFNPFANDLVYATQSCSTLAAVTLMTGTLTFYCPVQGLKARCRVSGKFQAPGSPGSADTRLYLMYSTGAGSPSVQSGPNGNTFAQAANQAANDIRGGYAKYTITSLSVGPNNFALGYYATVTGYNIIEPTLEVEITR